MNSAQKRVFSSLILLLIFTVALALRFYGLDWGFKDGVYSQHPDEWHYDSCATHMNPQGLSEEERQLPWRDQLRLLYERNLKVEPQLPYAPGSPGLRPVNYNYGTFPLHLYLLYRNYLARHFHPETGWTLLAFPDWLSLALLVFALYLGLRMYFGLSRDLRDLDHHRLPWHQDEQRLLFFFPCLILPVIGLILAAILPTKLVPSTGYNPATTSILLVGRVATAYAGAFTVLLAYLIGRDAYNRTTGLLAAAMLATAMLPVQTSHFATTDIILGFWTTAAVYCYLKITQKPRLGWYLRGGICAGFAVATKWSGITLPGILLLAHATATWGDEREGKTGRWIHTAWLAIAGLVLLHFFKAASSNNPPLNVTLAAFRDFYWGWKWIILTALFLLFAASIYLLILRKRWHGGRMGWFVPAVRIYIPWIWLILGILAGLAAFLIGQPMAYFDAEAFARDIAAQSRMHTTGEAPMVFTQQYLHTTPVFYTLDNLFYPSLDWITAFFTVAGCLYALGRLFRKGNASDLLLAAWVIPSFLMYSSFHSKFPRYLDAILPVMLVLGGRLITELSSIQPYFYNTAFPRIGPGWKKSAKYAGLLGGALALLCGLVYGTAYVRIYNQPHTLVTAGKIIQENRRPGAKITQNSWDNGLFGVHIESRDQIGIHDRPEEELRDPAARVRYLAQYLATYDYIVFPSKRGYGTTLQNPERFPITNQFLQAFFAEQLGFKIAAVITNPVRIFGWELHADLEDETARIYDHPKVIIFEKFQKFTQEQLESLIWSPPAWVTRITPREILTLREGHPVYEPPVSFPLLRWWLFLEGLGALAFVLLFPLGSALPDRGFGISKIVGLALFSWMGWFLASVGFLKVSTWQGALALGFLVILAVISARIHKDSLRQFIATKWPRLVALEILFLAFWGIFLVIRAYHPGAIGGEKPMNIAFINAVYRAETFPPEDPWALGHPINYYYYGHAILALAGRFIGLPAEYLFNIGGTTISGLTALAVFTLAHLLCRRAFIAFLATYLACFAGHFLSYLNLIRYELNETGESIRSVISSIIPTLQLMGWCLRRYLGFSTPEIEQRLRELRYDTFWESSRVIPNTVANEFPYWTHLFLDFHAHMLVMPFTFAFLILLYNYFARPREEKSGAVLGLSFFMGLLFGTVICTNTWDLPALAIAFLLITAVKFYRESDWFGGAPVRPRILCPESLQEIFRFPIAPVMLVFLFGIGLFLPFYSNFISRVSSVGIMTEGSTTVRTYLGFWIHLLVPLMITSVFLAVLRRDGRVSIPRGILFVSFFMLSVALALLLTRVNPFGLPIPRHAAAPLNYSIVGLFLPFFLVFFLLLWQRNQCQNFIFTCLLAVLGLGLSLGIEVFYIKEPGWGPPSHRWNTVFKFNLQVWHYLSIAAAISCWWIWGQIKTLGASLGRGFHYTGKMVFVLVMTAVLFPTLPFTLIAPAVVTASHRAISGEAQGQLPSLDGLEYLRAQNYGAYEAVQWVNRFVKGKPHIVEWADKHGGNHARFSSYTGLPALTGWPHHTRERLHYMDAVNPRLLALDRIYTSTNRDEIHRFLGEYQIDYLIFGEIERLSPRGDQNDRPPMGEAGLKHLEDFGDIFHLVYRNPDTSIFQIDRGLNRAYGLRTQTESEVQVPPAMRPPETGRSLFDGGRGSGNGEFQEPRGLIQDATGFFYVADTRNHRIQVFRPDGAYAWQVGTEGSGEGELKEPNDVAIDPQTGNLFIADTWNHRIVLVDSHGTFLGASLSNFFGPRGIAFHPQNRLLYIADTGNHRVVVMAPDGTVQQHWGKPGGGSEDDAFREPVGIDVTPDGNVIIVDSLNRRVKNYSAQGKLLGIWPIQTTWEGNGGFEGHVAVSPDGTIALTDPKEGSVHLYTAEGELLEKIFTDLAGRKLVQPIGILANAAGHLFVTDMQRGQAAQVK
ncbi:MAG: DUF2298 domain-containing protein [bacterium]